MESKKYLPLVYICSKYSGDVNTNTEAARRYSRFAVDEGGIALAPHLLFPQYMNDVNERGLAMHMALVLLSKCDEVWVFGEKMSDGMNEEITKAQKQRKKIRYFDSECKETNKALDKRPERMEEC